ncbi:holin [Arthrobacter phage Ottawa]|nr:holin [Arthrobacter phage Kharcho]WIC89283.1 holin [Arthrobacter phage Ottawa]
MAASQRTNPASVSPKVKAAGWTGLALTLLGALITGITPDMLDFLGEWKSLAFSIITAAGMLVAAYRKTDPARWDLTLNHPDEPAPVAWTPEPVVVPEPAPAANEVLGVYPDEDDDKPGKHEAIPAG